MTEPDWSTPPDPWAGTVPDLRAVPGGVPSVSPHSYRDALSRLAGGVGVVTTLDPVGRDCGITVTAVSAVSLVPPLVLVCVRTLGFLHDAISTADGWALSLLGAHQRDLAVYAARHRHPGDRDDFTAWPHERGPVTGVLGLTGGLTCVECVPHAAVDAGDHTIVIGRVVSVLPGLTEAPLVYVERAYHEIGAALGPGRVEGT